MEENHLSACPALVNENGEGCSCITEENRYLTLAKGSFGLFLIEFAGGWFSGSLALMSDALHVLVDGAENLVSAIVSRFARQGEEERVRKIGGMISAILLLSASIWIMYEGVERMTTPHKIKWYMTFVAIAGIVVNLKQREIHNQAPDEHLNVTHLWQDWHLLSDISTSAVVIAGGFIMLITDGLYWIDGFLSFGIGVWIAFFTLAKMLHFDLHGHHSHNRKSDCSDHSH